MRLHTIGVVFLASGAFAQAPNPTHARQQFDQRNYDAAKVEFTALAKTSPNDVTIRLYLGRIAIQQNDADEAVKQLERCGEIDDRNAECHAYLGDALGVAAQHASKFRQPFLAKRIKKEFEHAVELDPGCIEGRFGLVQFYMYAPGIMGGSAEKAVEQATELEKRNKLRGALAFATLANHDKKTPEAIAAYNRAIAAAPDSTVGYYSLVNVYSRDKQWSEAFATVDRLIARVPAERNALLAITRLAALSGEQMARGEDAARKWLANPPADATTATISSAHARLGGLYEKMGRKDQARAEFEQALKINPRNEEAKKGLETARPG